jgi:hypothetical protein
MQPYQFINHIINDEISSVRSDFIHFRFEDNIRFNHCAYNTMIQNYNRTPGFLIHTNANESNWQDYMAYTMVNHNTFFTGWGSEGFIKYWYTNKWNDVRPYYDPETMPRKTGVPVFIEHQWEPVLYDLDKPFWQSIVNWQQYLKNNHYVLHSEHNSADINQLRELGIKDIHWFAHAYLCSEFYFKHYQKLKMVTDYKSRPIEYPWISANRLLRDYRVEFMNKIDWRKGAYSLLETDPNGVKLWGNVPPNSFDVHDNHSAEIKIDDLTPWNTSFLHIVNETVWQDKIHFTEKVFKPIVLHQPFVVLQAPGSLEYLRSYGFRTFEDFWDESYDKIQDPIERMDAIASIVNWVADQNLYELRDGMAGVLEHNFRHFYENIPAICLDELRKGIANL